MNVFPSEGQLSSWIGVAPGNRISAGKNKSGATTRGNRWVRTTLVECAWAAAARKDSVLQERFRRLSVKGRKVALIAVAHQLAIILHRTLSSKLPYQESAEPFPDERKRQRLIRHYVRRLGKLGVTVHSLRPDTESHHKTKTGPIIHRHHGEP